MVYSRNLGPKLCSEICSPLKIPLKITVASEMAARNALLKYLRVNVNALPHLQNPRAGSGGLSQLIRRHFSEEARGSFLDKSEVTDRVLNVVKTFQKVDPSKVVSADISRHGLAMYVAVKVDKIGQGTVSRATNANFKNSSCSITVLTPLLFSGKKMVSLIVTDVPKEVTPTAHFQKDLGLDSLDTVEIVMALEEEFGFEIPDNEADKIHSINLAVDFIASHPQAK